MTPVARIIARRQYSMMQSVRAAGRAMESHPFERLPRKQKPAPANWAGDAKRFGVQIALYIPGISLLLGWPLLAAKVMDGHV
ncbi:pantothenate transporter liz1 [Cordyceps fumosorosea ARSEF 2679]|uniref:Pantothenate transporter liz1 n=1 Tax=Cordyceps fumosorosea (strain ARSEF 2679) TaxID=1081104 RepID=A0A167VUZ8_CORFA|nr:pantothenate transporter liz1 [Cordyceps fumosorosea ARSEF 2679]OAA63008.1 pantothenate transporter liz1 [Cordyceps fumosorosea ARSEF 2679]